MECHKPKRCLKEVSAGSGIFLGKAFVYEDEWLACHHCKRILGERDEEKTELDCRGERIEDEV